MKKILALLIGLFCIFSCINNNTGNGKVVIDTSDKELIEYMKPFTTVESPEDIKTEKVDLKVFQTFGDGQCLAYECSNKQYGWYNGSVVLYVANDAALVYDDKIIKGEAYFIGTYTYTTTAESKKTVKVYFESYDFAHNFVELANKIKEKE